MPSEPQTASLREVRVETLFPALQPIRERTACRTFFPPRAPVARDGDATIGYPRAKLPREPPFRFAFFIRLSY
jgi:hypothetical protein